MAASEISLGGLTVNAVVGGRKICTVSIIGEEQPIIVEAAAKEELMFKSGRTDSGALELSTIVRTSSYTNSTHMNWES